MTGVLMRSGSLHTGTDILPGQTDAGRMPCEDGACAATGRGTSGPPEAGGARKDPSTTSVRESLALLTAELGPLASASVRQ